MIRIVLLIRTITYRSSRLVILPTEFFKVELAILGILGLDKSKYLGYNESIEFTQEIRNEERHQ